VVFENDGAFPDPLFVGESLSVVKSKLFANGLWIIDFSSRDTGFCLTGYSFSGVVGIHCQVRAGGLKRFKKGSERTNGPHVGIQVERGWAGGETFLEEHLLVPIRKSGPRKIIDVSRLVLPPSGRVFPICHGKIAEVLRGKNGRPDFFEAAKD